MEVNGSRRLHPDGHPERSAAESKDLLLQEKSPRKGIGEREIPPLRSG
ncbi:hypothetical protein [Ravibacter arvi]